MVHKIKINLVNKELNDWETFLLNVTQDDIVEDTKDVFYHVTIPKHIFDAVKDTQDKYITDINDRKNIVGFSTKKPFLNKIKSISLSDIREQLSKLSIDALNTKKLKESEGVKMICVSFKHSYTKEREGIHGGYMGKSNSSRFQWFIAYKKEVRNNRMFLNESDPDFNVTVYMTNKQYKSGTFAKWDTSEKTEFESTAWTPLHRQNELKDFESKWHIIKWTEERELFFNAIEEKFNIINTELDGFLGNVTEENVEALMMSQNILQLKEKN